MKVLWMYEEEEGATSALPGRNRLRLVMMGFILALGILFGKFAFLSLLREADRHGVTIEDEKLPRPDIVDRTGRILATDLMVSSLYGEPQKFLDLDEVSEALSRALPELAPDALREKFSTSKSFVWIKRQLSPEERQRVEALGLAGIGFREEPLRVYPKGRLAAHVLGFVGVDSRGLAGIEKYLDDQGALYKAFLEEKNRQESTQGERGEAATLSIDVRVQYALEAELSKAMVHYRAKGAGGVVLNIKTGEVLGLVSLPDFNPNDATRTVMGKEQMNQMTGAVFELGSVVKAVTFAMALDLGVATWDKTYDARFPLELGRFKIHDYHPEHRFLTVWEIFLHSSNIGTAKMALEVGEDAHLAFLKKVGFFDRLKTELPESAAPLVPQRWSTLSTVTASYGHGIAIQPLQGASVIGAFLNGGVLVPPTFLKQDEQTARFLSKRLISQKASDTMRRLFRLNVEKGTATKADVPGYRVGGKTGTAEKVVRGKYDHSKRFNSFVGAFPMDDPRYVILCVLDEPQPAEGTYGFATAGWNVVPVSGAVVERIAPFLKVAPVLEAGDFEKLEKRRKENLKNAEHVPLPPLPVIDGD